MNVEDYLRQNYSNVKDIETITSNGQVVGYFATGSYGHDSIYIPVSAINNSNVGMVSYIPGAGGAGNDASALRDRIHNNPPDYIISIAQTCGDHYSCIDTGYNIAQGLNANVTRNVTVCFSASGFLGINHTESFLESHPDVSSVIISNEPYGSQNLKNTSALTSSNTPIIFAAPDSGFHIDMMSLIKSYKDSGLNAYLLETDYSSNAHIMTNKDVLTSGMLDYVLGYSDEFDTTRAGGYSFFRYDPNTGEFIIADYDEIAGSALAGIRIPDLSRLKAYDSFNIQKVASPVNEKYTSLKSIPTIDLDAIKMSSKYSIAASSMEEIRTQIKNSSFGNFSNYTFRSSSGIPGCIAAYINAYFDIVGSLMSSLTAETDSVLSYAQAVVDYDKELAENPDAVGQIVSKGTPDYIHIGLEDKSDTSKDDDKTDTSGNNGNSGSHDGGNNGGNNPDGGGTVVPPGNNIDKEETPKYTYKFDGYEGLIYMEGDRITGIKYRYTCDDATAAQNKLTEIKEKYKDAEYIKEVVVTDKYVDACFDMEKLKDMSLEKILEEYFKGGELRG